jgi:hypothetical protein
LIGGKVPDKDFSVIEGAIMRRKEQQLEDDIHRFKKISKVTRGMEYTMNPRSGNWNGNAPDGNGSALGIDRRYPNELDNDFRSDIGNF